MGEAKYSILNIRWKTSNGPINSPYVMAYCMGWERKENFPKTKVLWTVYVTEEVFRCFIKAGQAG